MWIVKCTSVPREKFSDKIQAVVTDSTDVRSVCFYTTHPTHGREANIDTLLDWNGIETEITEANTGNNAAANRCGWSKASSGLDKEISFENTLQW